METITELDSVCKAFGDLDALRDVSLIIERQERVVVIGASGSGKTTLLRSIAGLLDIDSGVIKIDGVPVAAAHDGRSTLSRAERKTSRNLRAMKVGMVFQAYNLFPHRTALENIIEAPIYVRGEARDQAVDRACTLLERVGVLDKKDKYPSQLSGGQQQRVAIARSLAMTPELILFDEVTSALDPELIGEVLEVMIDIAEQGQTMIVVTHEMGFAQRVGSKVIFMDHGRIVESGSPAAVLRSTREPRTKQFIGKILHMES